MIKHFLAKNLELIFWTAALISLGVSNPSAEAHFSLCPLKMLGITWCPGCGLGHAIAWLLHGNITNSIHAHWLGIPALFILLYRIFTLGSQLFLRTDFAAGKKMPL